MDLQYICTACEMSYSSTEKACPYCDTLCTVYQSNKRAISKLACRECGFQNHMSNVMCVACDAELFEEPEQQLNQKCEYCGEMILKKRLPEHSTNCMLSLQLIKEHQKQESMAKLLHIYKSSYIKCRYCSIQIPEDLLNDHNQVCEKKPKPVPRPALLKKPLYEPPKPIPPSKPIRVIPYTKPPVNPPVEDEGPYVQIGIDKFQLFEQSQLKRLSPKQEYAILYMHQKSSKLHQAARKQLTDKIGKLKYKNVDLENLLFYIQNYAPIIIHIHITKHMEFFVKDTHYRNQFETGKSSGTLNRSSRTQWENRMFDNKYAKATDHQRVKYGVINFTNDPKGVNCASGYGMSYFLLKSHVRNRCTMTDMDSSSATCSIGTFKYCFHVLNKMNDKELVSAFNAAKALEQSSTVTTTYKEIQIHGPIQFAKDIERIYVNKKQVQNKKFLDMVYQFCEKNKVDYQFI